jgi:hypothetical protein
MTEHASRNAAFHPLAPLVARALDDVVKLARAVVTPLKRANDVNPEIPLNLAIGWDALERLKATPDYREPIATVRHRWDGHPLGYLHRGLRGRAALEFFLTVKERDDEGVLNALEPVLRGPELLAAVREAVDTAPVHDASSKQQLAAGLGHLERAEWALAWPLLIIPVEGAFRASARALRLVDDGQRLATEDGQRRRAQIEELFELLGLEESFRVFLRRRVYGSIANPHRHGTPQGGHRRQSLFLMVALIGWLDAFAQSRLAAELFTGLGRELERRQIGALQRRLRDAA